MESFEGSPKEVRSVNSENQDVESTQQELDRLKMVHAPDTDDGGFVRLEQLAQDELGETAQYLVDFIDGNNGKPLLFDGLQFKGAASNFETIRIHEDDMLDFLKRYREYKEQKIQEMKRQLGV